MSGTYQEIDLENLDKTPVDDGLEIVDEVEETEASTTPAPAPTVPVAEDDDDDDGEAEGAGKRKLSRSQRLKAQRDAFAARLRDTEAKLTAAEQRAQRAESSSSDATSVGMDLLIQSLDAELKGLRGEFDVAYDAGDKDKLFDVQVKMNQKAAEKVQAETERRRLPTRAVNQDKSGGDRPQQATPTQGDKPPPSPGAVSWYRRNREWFNKDQVLTAVAHTVDRELISEGRQPTDDDYYEELDRRVREEMPHKFKAEEKAAPKARPGPGPTVQNRTTGGAPAAGTVRVTITKADRDMAEHLGLDIKTYAREKLKQEAASKTANQYTEIL